ncbi:purine and uridine phosphorylase [Phanerochaete sordida]|uniref:Purine and uridine phosphorylase n=1 Tax=Phanerochaete sordida TaxID=48140 RepID=A0A9P3G7J5_9APHY|nr:purine and uridine phosphorylase [Phanerochaete sordida]
MKDLVTDANFPRTLDQRVYHLGIRAGEVANRIITVGSPSRAERIAGFLDASPAPFRLATERGFLTITGRYQGTPLSIVSIGMGNAMADFFVREVRECLSGDMVVVRLGSCGGLVDIKVGSVVVPRASIAVNRNYDFDFQTGQSTEAPYRYSKPVQADDELRAAVAKTLRDTRPPTVAAGVITDTINASTDSFYSSQGRQTSFPDCNSGVIKDLQGLHKDLATFEMETFQILHLAASWPTDSHAHASEAAAPPVSGRPATPAVSGTQASAPQSPPADVHAASKDGVPLSPRPRIRAAAAHIVFAARDSREFITPAEVEQIEDWAGRGVLEALAHFAIAPERLHADEGSVWEQ